ncbi:MAG TPA: hypothetical protein VM925_31235, partial [Labilithrix sp.]|nr:hypothetical protein [Labilithrix sp.]
MNRMFALFATCFAAVLACGGGKQEASFSVGGNDGGTTQAACSPGQPCAQSTPSQCPPGQPCASCPPGQACAITQGGPAPLGTVQTTDPSALASLLAAAAAAGSALLGPPSAAEGPAEAGLRAAAAQHAPGMSPEGPVARGNLADGGHVDFVVQLEPSKCYAVVAYGAGVMDLDVNLLAPPLYNFLAAQDGMAGPAAVLGAAPKPMCPVVPVAVPYKVDLHAKKGGGQVAAQLYS